MRDGIHGLVDAIYMSIGTDPNVDFNYQRSSFRGQSSGYSTKFPLGSSASVELRNSLSGEMQMGYLRVADGSLDAKAVQEMRLASINSVQYVRTVVHGESLWRWDYLHNFLSGAQKDSYIAFVVVHAENSGNGPLLAGYATGGIDWRLKRIEVDYVETLPMYQGQNVAKALSGLVMARGIYLGLPSAYVCNTARLPGAKVYLRAAAMVGYTHVTLAASVLHPVQNENPVLQTQRVRLVNEDGFFTGLTELCLAMRLPVRKCGCGLVGRHCFDEFGILEFTFSS